MKVTSHSRNRVICDNVYYKHAVNVDGLTFLEHNGNFRRCMDYNMDNSVHTGLSQWGYVMQTNAQ